MSMNVPPGARLGLRDAKRLARSLQSELSTARPSDLAQCQALVARLPLPPVSRPLNDLFATGSVAEILHNFVAPLGEPQGSEVMWHGRARQMLSSLLEIVVWQRDHQGLPLTEKSVLDQLDLDTYHALAKRSDIPPSISMPALQYLRALPGFDLDASSQSETVYDHHGYLTMYFVRHGVVLPTLPPDQVSTSQPRNALRRKPEVIQLGEAASADLMAALASANEAGHVVTSTIHLPVPPPLVIQGSSAPAGSLSLGRLIKKKGGIADLFSRTPPALSWTPDGILRHGLLFGCCGSGQTETVVSLAVDAVNQGYGVTLINGHGDNSLVIKFQRHMSSWPAEVQSRVRILNFLTGGHPTPQVTHTFNPFASGSAAALIELMYEALSVPGILDELPASHQSLAFHLLSAVMFPLVWGRDRNQWPLDLARVANSLKLSELQRLRAQSDLPRQIQVAIDLFFKTLSEKCPGQTLENAYAPFEAELVENVLLPLAQEYAPIFAARQEPSRWQLPQVSPHAMLSERLVTVVCLPAMEKGPSRTQVAARLVTSALAAEVLTAGQRTTHSLRHLVIAQHAPLYLSGRSANQLINFSRNAGVGCLLTTTDYPQIKKVPGLVDAIGQCHTKFFMKQCDSLSAQESHMLVGDLAPSEKEVDALREGQAHVIAGSQLWRASLAYIPPPKTTPPLPAFYMPIHWHTLNGSMTFTPGQVDPVRMGRVLWERLSGHSSVTPLSWCQETVARMLGYAHWHELSS